MNKKLAKMDKQSRFEFCRDRMREYTAAYWDMVLEIYEGELWENEYDSFDEFRKAEVDYSERRVRQRLAAERTKRLLDRQKLPVDKAKTAHFEAIAAVENEKEQVEIYKEVLETCKEEEREPTTKDFRQAVRERHPKPESNGKPSNPPSVVESIREPGEDEPSEPSESEIAKMNAKLRASFVATLERLMRDIDDFNRRIPNKERHAEFVKVYHQAHGLIKGWK